MKKLIAVFTLAVATVALAPRPVAAQHADCSWGYTQCLNDSWELKGILQSMADIECFTDYLGCIRKGILGM